jgi:KTSC domain-containing protein
MLPLVSPAIPSSNIVGLGYEPESQTMDIGFASGDVYEYTNVPIEVYTQIFNGSIADPKDGKASVGHTAWALGVTNKKAPLYAYSRIVIGDSSVAAMNKKLAGFGGITAPLSDIVNPPSYIPFGQTGTPLSAPTIPPIPIFPLPNITQPPVTQPAPDINKPQNPIA